MRSFTHTLGGMARACLCGVLTGAFTAAVIVLYKLCANAVIALSERGYTYLRGHLYWLPAVLAVLGILAAVFARIYRRYPNMRGGGIPTSIGILRGIIRFDWLKNLIGTFTLSLVTFVIGVPLGNEGPSVQMGTAIGRGTCRLFLKSHRALDRYAMTGGACAGFSSATGAPLSGILFAIEEAHGRLSPLILLVSAVSVLTARAVSEWLSPLCGVGVPLFPRLQPIDLPTRDLWLPLLVGAVIGLFSVLFLHYYRALYTLLHRTLRHWRHDVLLFIIFALTLAAGLCSFFFVSTGHELILHLFDSDIVLLLVPILLVRTTLTLGANTAGVTGGVFVPILALGATTAAALGRVLQLLGLPTDYTLLVLLLGITACVAGTMKMPLTAMVFAVEALSCDRNLLPVITAAVTAFAITELFRIPSLSEHVLERKVQHLNGGKTAEVYDTFVTVQPGSFVVGKQIRDILWPANLFVLSVQHEVDQHGEKTISAGDVLHVRYSTVDQAQTKAELIAIVGEQHYSETKTDII